MVQDPNELPAVNEQRLAELLGLKAWPADLKFNHIQRIAARTITDGLLPRLHSVSGRVAEECLENAAAWIRSSYDDGFDAGRREERRIWAHKIATLFGLDGPKGQNS